MKHKLHHILCFSSLILVKENITTMHMHAQTGVISKLRITWLPFLDASGDELGQVPALAVLHDNVQRGVTSVYDAVVVPYYVWVLKLPQEVHL